MLEIVDNFEFAQDMIQLRTFIKTVISLHVPYKQEKFLNKYQLLKKGSALRS
jgi:hypothetical protein